MGPTAGNYPRLTCGCLFECLCHPSTRFTSLTVTVTVLRRRKQCGGLGNLPVAELAAGGRDSRPAAGLRACAQPGASCLPDAASTPLPRCLFSCRPPPCSVPRSVQGAEVLESSWLSPAWQSPALCSLQRFWAIKKRGGRFTLQIRESIHLALSGPGAGPGTAPPKPRLSGASRRAKPWFPQ